MKVKLLRAARIRHEAGEIVEVSPAEAGFLLSTGSAAPVAEEKPETQRETPEDKVEPKIVRSKKPAAKK